MSFKVKILSRASIEFESQVVYLQKRSPNGARAWAKEYKKTVKEIGVEPRRFGLAPESEIYEAEIREARFQTKKGNPYRVVFTVSDEEKMVFIFSVPGLGQDYVNF